MKALQSDFDSIKALVDYTIPRLLAKDKEGLKKALVSRKEYIESLHGHTPEGSAQKGGLSGEDKWRIFTGPRRSAAIAKNLAIYGKRGFEYVGFGTAQKVIAHGPLKLHRKIPVKLKALKTGKVETVYTMMAVVAEKNGKFKLLNVFRD